MVIKCACASNAICARHSGKMTAHARLFSRVSSRAVCEWTLEGKNETSIPRNFKPSVEGNEFYYLKRHWNFDRDASGVICRKLQTVSGLHSRPQSSCLYHVTDGDKSSGELHARVARIWLQGSRSACSCFQKQL